jgi:hypothetical protein
MDKMLPWSFRLGQNVTVDVVNLDVTSRQPLLPLYVGLSYAGNEQGGWSDVNFKSYVIKKIAYKLSTFVFG